ncbi:unnamed protein product [Urochloa decumbens]|uniref:Uncharacterized protein n=1 Tax=Urochloa decumbens TaxID=240449 RepID=A0ABC9E790_9POAL
MLHLKNHLGIPFRHPWLLSVARFATTAAAAGEAPTPFAVEDYLPDAVLAFLSGLGLSAPDVAPAITRDPYLLCCDADATLALRAAELRDLGLRPSQIAQLVLLVPTRFRHPDIVPKLRYFIPFFGSFDNLVRALKSSGPYLLNVDLERVVKPNVSCLRECALSAHEISKTCMFQPRLLYSKQERIRAMLARAEGIGRPCGTPMFRHALLFVASRNKETIAAKMELLKKAFRWSDAEVASAVSRQPSVLAISEDRARRVSEFLISEVGLDPAYIARRPNLTSFSLEGRLIPRHYVVKYLEANGLLGRDWSYSCYTVVKNTEKAFVQKFIHPYKASAPHLAEDYADACRGEMPSRFRLQELGTGLASV